MTFDNAFTTGEACVGGQPGNIYIYLSLSFSPRKNTASSCCGPAALSALEVQLYDARHEVDI